MSEGTSVHQYLRFVEGESLKMAIDEIQLHPDNPRKGDLELIGSSIDRFGFYGRIIVQKSTGYILAGNHRYKALLERNARFVPVELVDVDDETALGIVLADNRTSDYAEYEDNLLTGILSKLNDMNEKEGLAGTGYTDDDYQSLLSGLGLPETDPFEDLGMLHTPPNKSATKKPQKGSLVEQFVVPPFSVLDTRKSYWKKRKEAWLELGIQSELGRGETLLNKNSEQGQRPQDFDGGNGWLGKKSSVFDPVLCELAYRWFSPKKGKVLDPFAGGSVRGIVASLLGRKYMGIDLRKEQCEENGWQFLDVRETCKGLDEFEEAVLEAWEPSWFDGDSLELLDGFERDFDFLFTCPPYVNLEVYSEDKRDLSTMIYEDFLLAYRGIIQKSCDCLKENTFASIVVGEVRHNNSFYYGFVKDTIQAFLDAGLELYNDCVIITPGGSLPIRAGKDFRASRKLGKTHQNFLVFIKGDPGRATDSLGEFEASDSFDVDSE